jgi:SAM-dependent methyltransferase
MSVPTDSLAIDFPRCLERDFPRELPAAAASVARVSCELPGMSFETLERHSPALKGYDWNGYLRCSIARMVHAAAALAESVPRGRRVLDYGSYFGNVALMLQSMGYRVDAVDAYGAYGGAFSSNRRLLEAADVRVLDFADVGVELNAIADRSYDAVVCLGVIEHIPHSPKTFLESLDRVLTTGGTLILDTPNHAYLYQRRRLARGESLMAPIETQFHSPIPFEGHHREYTPDEMVWMLRQIGHVDLAVEMFNYSVYGMTTLTGDNLRDQWTMTLDPSMREVIMTSSRKPDGLARSDRDERAWPELLIERESFWPSIVPDQVRAERSLGAGDLIITEQRRVAAEIVRRDRTIAELHERLGDLERARDGLWRNRVRRLLSRLSRDRSGDRRTGS